MVSMRTIAFASALASGSAATLHMVETYSGSDCAAADLYKSSFYMEACEYKGAFFRIHTCNGTHLIETSYSDAACTNVTEVDAEELPASNCKKIEDHRYRKVVCAAAQADIGQVKMYAEDTCDTNTTNHPYSTYMFRDRCLRTGHVNASGGVVPHSEMHKYTPGVAHLVTQHPGSFDCSSSSTSNYTHTCSGCIAGAFAYNMNISMVCPSPNAAGSASSGRRSTPWAVATFGAAVLAIGAAQRVTA